MSFTTSRIKIPFSRFFISLTALSLLIITVMIALERYSGIGRFSAYEWGGLVFFYIGNLMVYMLAIQAFKVNPKSFLRIIYLSMGTRLFLSLAYLITCLVLSGETSIRFVMVFFILYLLFTVFEIYCLVINLRPDFKKSPISDE